MGSAESIPYKNVDFDTLKKNHIQTLKENETKHKKNNSSYITLAQCSKDDNHNIRFKG
tara:strand:- start:532 stop:705 length:174 start_codon:yes stop_codon:yes gene_type:complete